jgi:hypothetical protein
LYKRKKSTDIAVVAIFTELVKGYWIWSWLKIRIANPNHLKFDIANVEQLGSCCWGISFNIPLPQSFYEQNDLTAFFTAGADVVHKQSDRSSVP